MRETDAHQLTYPYNGWTCSKGGNYCSVQATTVENKTIDLGYCDGTEGGCLEEIAEEAGVKAATQCGSFPEILLHEFTDVYTQDCNGNPTAGYTAVAFDIRHTN